MIMNHTTSPHRLTNTELGRGRYAVSCQDEVFAPNTSIPILDGCRVLQARGITGRAEMWREGTTYPAMISTVGVAAGLKVTEGNHRPRLAKWGPFGGIGKGDGEE